MFLSKFWNLVLAIIVAILLSVIFLVPASINETRKRSGEAMMLKDRMQVETILRMEARSRIDATILFATDQVVRQQLYLASSRKSVDEIPDDVKDKLFVRLRNLNEKLTNMKADILFAVDVRGIVVAQLGENERKSGYSLKGFPLVADALRGYLRDDTWMFGGKLFRMAARPVIHVGSYVGAIIHGKKLDSTFASLLARAIDAQVGIYIGERLLGVGLPEGVEKEAGAGKGAAGSEHNNKKYASDPEIRTILMDVVFKDKNYREKGKSSILMRKGKYCFVALKIVGEARENNAGIFLLRPLEISTGVSDFLSSVSRDEIRNVPWIFVGGIAFVLLLMGVLIVYFEGDRPKVKFLREVEKMAATEGERLNIYLFRGKYRKIADAINRAIDRAVQILVSRATGSIPSVSKILGSPDERLSKPAFEIREKISLDEIPPPPPEERGKARRVDKGKVAEDAGRGGVFSAAQPSPPSAPQKVPPRQPPAPAPPAVPHVATRRSPTAPVAVSSAPSKSAPPQVQSPAPSWGGGLDEEETRVYTGDREQIFAAVERQPGERPQTPQAQVSPPSDEDEYYRKIFDEFYKTKISCGESVENLTFERFKATLKKQQEAIKERMKCRKVEFKVYVKDGKAALKASPIK